LTTGLFDPAADTFISSRGSGAAAENGAYFATAGRIELTFDNTPTSGVLSVLVHVLNRNDSWRKTEAALY